MGQIRVTDVLLALAAIVLIVANCTVHNGYRTTKALEELSAETAEFCEAQSGLNDATRDMLAELASATRGADVCATALLMSAGDGYEETAEWADKTLAELQREKNNHETYIARWKRAIANPDILRIGFKERYDSHQVCYGAYQDTDRCYSLGAEGQAALLQVVKDELARDTATLAHITGLLDKAASAIGVKAEESE
ncbi:MAG: hypothetical protein GY832_22265 [Chloroflexi bacterium]|nr:hypothetical protein [Chloroflexota bacterium]